MLPPEKYYLKLGKASDLKDKRERLVYRALEILPGALSWLTLLSVIFLSWLKPVWVAFFIITFDIYWLLKTIYFSIHLRATYMKMREQIKMDWLAKLKQADAKLVWGRNWRDIYHLVIAPASSESFEVIDSACQAILDSDYPNDRMIVVLATEERAGQEAQDIGRRIKEKYGDKFFKFFITVHPDDIVGELKGKGANSTWAARQVKRDCIDKLKIPYENIIVSCFDSDTQVYPRYFSCLTYHYLTAERPTRHGYQPIPVYNNNIWQAPCFSRVVATSATFWQMIQQQRPERLSTFSSHSLSFQALVDTDFWGVNMVSEDSRAFWQCLVFYNGDYATIPLYYPVSMDANVSRNPLKTARNVYVQQRRWGWGAENIPYLLFAFWKNKKIPGWQKLHWAWVQFEGFWSWATNALLIFLLGWLPLFLGGQKFNVTVLSYNLPRVTRILMTMAMVGLVGSAIYSTLLLPKAPKKYGWAKKCARWLGMIVQWLLVPITILVFGALPGLDAQTRLLLGKYMGFWVTPKEG